MTTVHREGWKRLKAEETEGPLSVAGKKHRLKNEGRHKVSYDRKGQSGEHVLNSTTINLQFLPWQMTTHY